MFKALPTLTSLAHLQCFVDQIDTLSSLPLLRTLELDLAADENSNAPKFLESLRTMSSLTSLSISFDSSWNFAGPGWFTCTRSFSSHQLATCLEHLHQLETLKLTHFENMDSLNFLTIGTLPRTLTDLYLRQSGRSRSMLYPEEIDEHVSVLKNIRKMSLVNIFDHRCLTTEHNNMLKAKSVAFPHLESFYLDAFDWRDATWTRKKSPVMT